MSNEKNQGENPMTSKLKCPVCPYCNKLLHCSGTQYIDGHVVTMWCCTNYECEQSEYLIGTREMWEIVAIMIQAKQDLVIATKALENIVSDYEVDASNGWLAANAKRALETIGKQKDNK